LIQSSGKIEALLASLKLLNLIRASLSGGHHHGGSHQHKMKQKEMTLEEIHHENQHEVLKGNVKASIKNSAI